MSCHLSSTSMMNNINLIFRNLINFNRGTIASIFVFLLLINTLFTLDINYICGLFGLLLNSLMFIVLFYLTIIITLGLVLFNNLHKFSIKNNNVVYNSKYGKLLFEADFLKMSIGPISIILDP